MKRDPRIVPLEEQKAEAIEKIQDEVEEIPMEDIKQEQPRKSYLVTFTFGQSHSEYTMQEGSMEVALGGSFSKWKTSLPKWARIKELNIQIKAI